jgi:hypothetical protein
MAAQLPPTSCSTGKSLHDHIRSYSIVLGYAGSARLLSVIVVFLAIGHMLYCILAPRWQAGAINYTSVTNLQQQTYASKLT